MVGRFQERRYQLTAQKRNETYLRYNYYQQIARYFERECENARQYDSWTIKDTDIQKRLEKTKKAEMLVIRKNKLRHLLKEEEEECQKELEQLQIKEKEEESPSLEDLRERLKEKRAEEDLYHPKGRRFQSHFDCPTDPVGTHWTHYHDTNPSTTGSSSHKNDYGLFNENLREHSPEKRTQFEGQSGVDKCLSTFDAQEAEPKWGNLRYAERYSRRSLEDTNVCFNDPHNEHRYTPSQRRECSASPESPNKSMDKTDRANRAKETARSDYREEQEFVNEGPLINLEDRSVIDFVQRADMNADNEQSSKEMYVYLLHKELKCKIEDLAKRESGACMKHNWNEALRLRNMRNRLELIREKRLYNMDALDMNDEARNLGFKNIEKREEQLDGRENASTNSSMYSEEAKALWKKWVHEDQAAVIQDARSQREILMKKLENEWQRLAARDKERISRSFQNIINGSAVQEEHKLLAEVAARKSKCTSSPVK